MNISNINSNNSRAQYGKSFGMKLTMSHSALNRAVATWDKWVPFDSCHETSVQSIKNVITRMKFLSKGLLKHKSKKEIKKEIVDCKRRSCILRNFDMLKSEFEKATAVIPEDEIRIDLVESEKSPILFSPTHIAPDGRETKHPLVFSSPIDYIPTSKHCKNVETKTAKLLADAGFVISDNQMGKYLNCEGDYLIDNGLDATKGRRLKVESGLFDFKMQIKHYLAEEKAKRKS